MGERMPAVGLSEAAKLTGRNQSTIHRALKTGRLAFAVAENGERRIDIAELERAFGLKGSASQDAIAQPLQSNAVQAGELQPCNGFLTIARPRFATCVQGSMQARQSAGQPRPR